MAQAPAKRSGFNLFWLIVVVFVAAAGGLAWKHQSEKRERERAAAAIRAELRGIEALAKQWDDALILASSAPRIALAGPAKSLQDIKRQVGSTMVSGCAIGPKVRLEAAMGAQLDGVLAFMANTDSGPAAVRAGNEVAAPMLAEYQDLMKKCASSLPF
jgi:hypothetical protein